MIQAQTQQGQQAKDRQYDRTFHGRELLGRCKTKRGERRQRAKERYDEHRFLIVFEKWFGSVADPKGNADHGEKEARTSEVGPVDPLSRDV